MTHAGSGSVPLRSPLDRGAAKLARETIFDVLRNKRRRYALHYLKQEAEPIDVGSLAEQIAAWEYDTPLAQVSTQQRQRVYVSLVQTHLPTMEREGIIEFDEDDKRVALTEEASDLDVYLEVVRENDIEWSHYYLGIAGINAVLLGIASLDLPVLSRAPGELWVLAVAVVFLLAALVHHWYQRRIRLGVEGPPPN